MLRRLTNSWWAISLSLYFVYFTGSFGWIVEFLRNRSFSGESAFWANQPVSLNLNPPFASSLVVFIALTYLLSFYFEKRTKIVTIIIALIIGSLVGFKIYAAMLCLLALGLLGLWELIKERTFSLIGLLILSGFASLAILLPNYAAGTAQSVFIFSPWWMIHTMVDYSDRVGWLKLSQARDAYFQRGDWLKYVLVEGLGFGLFIAGNLGVRTVALIGFKKYISEKMGLFLVLVLILSMVIPLLFIQQGTAWNTIQFFYYALYIVGLS